MSTELIYGTFEAIVSASVSPHTVIVDPAQCTQLWPINLASKFLQQCVWFTFLLECIPGQPLRAGEAKKNNKKENSSKCHSN